MISSTSRLRENELLATLTEEELSRLAPLCSDFVVIEDTIICTEGRKASHLYVVTEGQVALQKAIRVPHATRSRRTIIAVCRPGEIVGWSALAEPFTYTVSAVAWESSTLISIDAKMLRMALEMHHEMGYKVMKSLSAIMSRRLRQTTDALINERKLSYSGLIGPPKA